MWNYTLPSIGIIPSGDESFTTMDTSFWHFKQVVDKFSMKVAQLSFKQWFLKKYLL